MSSDPVIQDILRPVDGTLLLQNPTQFAGVAGQQVMAGQQGMGPVPGMAPPGMSTDTVENVLNSESQQHLIALCR